MKESGTLDLKLEAGWKPALQTRRSQKLFRMIDQESGESLEECGQSEIVRLKLRHHIQCLLHVF